MAHFQKKKELKEQNVKVDMCTLIIMVPFILYAVELANVPSE